MSFFNRLFKKKDQSLPLEKLNLTIREKVTISIRLYFRWYNNVDALKEAIFQVTDSNEEEAKLIYLFIPKVFCSLYVPEIKYSDIYFMKDLHGKEKEYKFSESPIYNEIRLVATELWNEYSGDEIMKVLFHSGDFKAINEALKAGATLDKLESIPSRIL